MRREFLTRVLEAFFSASGSSKYGVWKAAAFEQNPKHEIRRCLFPSGPSVFFQDLCSCCSPRRPTLLHFSTRDSLNFNRYQEQGCRLSRRPQKGQRLICLVFFEICFSLWFRSDSLSVSPEPELQIHCVFQGFLFFFSNVLVFSMQTKGFF